MAEEADLIIAVREAITRTQALQKQVQDLHQQAERNDITASAAVSAVKSAKRMHWKLVVLVVALSLVVSYMAMSMHEAYRNHCDPRLSGAPAPKWCDYVFIGDVHHGTMTAEPIVEHVH